jgi:hypothetical protein
MGSAPPVQTEPFTTQKQEHVRNHVVPMKSSTTKINVNAKITTTKSMEHVDNALPDKFMIPQPQHAPAPPVVQMKSH